MSLHSWLGRHVPDVDANRWKHGAFVSRCAVCSGVMEKLPGLGWRLRKALN
jgi:hypothetical protein